MEGAAGLEARMMAETGAEAKLVNPLALVADTTTEMGPAFNPLTSIAGCLLSTCIFPGCIVAVYSTIDPLPELMGGWKAILATVRPVEITVTPVGGDGNGDDRTTMIGFDGSDTKPSLFVAVTDSVQVPVGI